MKKENLQLRNALLHSNIVRASVAVDDGSENAKQSAQLRKQRSNMQQRQ